MEGKKGIFVSTWGGRIFIASIAVLLIAAFFGVGVLLSNTHDESRVASNARQLHWTNSTLGAAGIARASIAQAVFFSFESDSDIGAREVAGEEARDNLETVSLAASTPDAHADLIAAIQAFVAAGEQVVELAESGEGPTAEAMRLGEAEPAFESLSSQLQDRQTQLAALINDSENSAGRVSRITFLAITFLIPAVAMIVFWFVLRRRMRTSEAEMQARVDAERKLNHAKDALIAGLSHELRTPLTSISGFSEILLEDPALAGEAHELMYLINASSSDLTRMVNDLLAAARLDAAALTTSPQEMDLAEQVNAIAAPYVRAGERLDVRVPPINTYADPLHVRQIIQNLVSNALRHGGNEVMITGRQVQDESVLVVADNGTGVPEEMEGKLFNRFANAGRDALVAGSVGLGLAISRELATQMNGTLQYRREDGWTIFALRLPSVPAIDLDEIESYLMAESEGRT